MTARVFIRRCRMRPTPTSPTPTALAIKAYLFSLRCRCMRPLPDKHAGVTPVQPAFGNGIIGQLLFNANARFAPNTDQQRGMEQRRLYRRAVAHCGECHAPRITQSPSTNGKKVRRRDDCGLARLQHHLGQGLRNRRLERRRAVRLSGNRPRVRPRHGGGSDGRSRRPKFQPDGAVRHSRAGQLCAQRSAYRLNRPAGDAGTAGAGLAEGKAARRRTRSAKKFSKNPA